jgi:hypothetical protein
LLYVETQGCVVVSTRKCRNTDEIRNTLAALLVNMARILISSNLLEKNWKCAGLLGVPLV